LTADFVCLLLAKTRSHQTSIQLFVSVFLLVEHNKFMLIK